MRERKAPQRFEFSPTHRCVDDFSSSDYDDGSSIDSNDEYRSSGESESSNSEMDEYENDSFIDDTASIENVDSKSEETPSEISSNDEDSQSYYTKCYLGGQPRHSVEPPPIASPVWDPASCVTSTEAESAL